MNSPCLNDHGSRQYSDFRRNCYHYSKPYWEHVAKTNESQFPDQASIKCSNHDGGLVPRSDEEITGRRTHMMVLQLFEVSDGLIKMSTTSSVEESVIHICINNTNFSYYK